MDKRLRRPYVLKFLNVSLPSTSPSLLASHSRTYPLPCSDQDKEDPSVIANEVDDIVGQIKSLETSLGAKVND